MTSKNIKPEVGGEETNRKEEDTKLYIKYTPRHMNIAKDMKVIPEPIDDRKFQEWK